MVKLYDLTTLMENGCGVCGGKRELGEGVWREKRVYVEVGGRSVSII